MAYNTYICDWGRFGLHMLHPGDLADSICTQGASGLLQHLQLLKVYLTTLAPTSMAALEVWPTTLISRERQA